MEVVDSIIYSLTDSWTSCKVKNLAILMDRESLEGNMVPWMDNFLSGNFPELEDLTLVLKHYGDSRLRGYESEECIFIDPIDLRKTLDQYERFLSGEVDGLNQVSSLPELDYEWAKFDPEELDGWKQETWIYCRQWKTPPRVHYKVAVTSSVK